MLIYSSNRLSPPTPGQSCVVISAWQARYGSPHFGLTWHAFGSIGPWLLPLRYKGWRPVGVCDGLTAELVTSHAILVIVRRFIGMGVVDSRSLRPLSYLQSQ
jgi:hypothetical protein